MIPKRVVQIWIGPKPRPSALMRRWEWMSWAMGWDYVLLTSGKGWKNQKLIDRAWDIAGKTDIMRYEFLLENGGIYIDADTELLHPLDDHFLEREFWAAWESEIKRPGLLANGQLGAEPGAKILSDMLKVIPYRDLEHLEPWKTTGPNLLTELYQLHKDSVHVYPGRTFNPIHFDGKTPAPGTSRIYGRHLWGSHGRVYEGDKGGPALEEHDNFPGGNVACPPRLKALPTFTQPPKDPRAGGPI